MALATSSAHFIAPKVVFNKPHSLPACLKYRPVRISAACASTAQRTRPHILSSSSLYQALGIQTGATCQEIKAAYRRLARVLHPDVAAAAANGQNDRTSYEFIKIHEAYATLSDPEKRADYDRKLFRPRRPVDSSFAMSKSTTMGCSSSVSGFSGYTTRRTWETDQCW